jgi:hypothetical protein
MKILLDVEMSDENYQALQRLLKSRHPGISERSLEYVGLINDLWYHGLGPLFHRLLVTEEIEGRKEELRKDDTKNPTYKADHRKYRAKINGEEFVSSPVSWF